MLVLVTIRESHIWESANIVNNQRVFASDNRLRLRQSRKRAPRFRVPARHSQVCRKRARQMQHVLEIA